MADIRVLDHGSIVILHGGTEAGIAWLEANLDPEAQRWGRAGFAAEPRYVENICEAALDDGLEVA